VRKTSKREWGGENGRIYVGDPKTEKGLEKKNPRESKRSKGGRRKMEKIQLFQKGGK